MNHEIEYADGKNDFGVFLHVFEDGARVRLWTAIKSPYFAHMKYSLNYVLDNGTEVCIYAETPKELDEIDKEINISICLYDIIPVAINGYKTRFVENGAIMVSGPQIIYTKSG